MEAPLTNFKAEIARDVSVDDRVEVEQIDCPNAAT